MIIQIMLPFCCHRGHEHGKKPLFMGFFTGAKSFPLNRADRLGGEIHYDAVDTFDLMGDAVGDMM